MDYIVSMVYCYVLKECPPNKVHVFFSERPGRVSFKWSHMYGTIQKYIPEAMTSPRTSHCAQEAILNRLCNRWW